MKTKLILASLGAVAFGGAALTVAWPRQLRWGATAREITDALPGDDLIVAPDLAATRAITIAASAGWVWPWIAQIGQGRGGFYSYSCLENLVGCQIRNADRIVPEWQAVAAGDEIRLAPRVPLRVAAVTPGRSLVLRGGVPAGGGAPPYEFTWAFVIGDQSDGTTRLVVRERYGYARGWAKYLVEPVEFVSAIMTRKMLRGIRDRAERLAPEDMPTSAE